MAEFNYQITEKIAVLSQNGNLTKELNKVSFNGAEPKFDIRAWKRADGEEKMFKGVTLTDDELQALKTALETL